MGPFLVLAGVMMVVTAAKGTHIALGNQLVKDFTGPGNFVWWFVAIGVLGALMRVPQMDKVAKPFLFLVVAAMLLSNQGFFNAFIQALQKGPETPQREALVQAPSQTTAAQASSALSTGSNLLSSVVKLAPFLA